MIILRSTTFPSYTFSVHLQREGRELRRLETLIDTVFAITILGKDGFNFLKEKVFALLRRAAPNAKVSRTRYRAGLAIWALLFIYGSFVWYAPHLVPGYSGYRVALNLTADFLFITSLFVFGGDFWEKFRSLFIYDA